MYARVWVCVCVLRKYFALHVHGLFLHFWGILVYHILFIGHSIWLKVSLLVYTLAALIIDN